jgi:glycosyltransferase involved in cell wall biosynthesis
MRALYLSHTGMTEPLGQAQVVPYLAGLARSGVELDIVSFEPASTERARLTATRAQLHDLALRWHPLVRSPSHALGRKLYEASAATLRGLAIAVRRRPRIIHARSHLPAAVAERLASWLPGARFLFDCRGMVGDEYVDGGHWTADSSRYRLLKRVERRLFARADGLVVLTDALRGWLAGADLIAAHTEVAVIPCCVDESRFRPDASARAEMRRRLGVEDRLVAVYSGTLGAWYREREMVQLAAALDRKTPTTLLVLTRAPSDALRSLAAQARLDVQVHAVASDDMPRMLSAADIGLSLIEPCFSKKGSSPTKVAEYLACGLPVVTNAGVGDQVDLAMDPDACVVIPSLDHGAVSAAAEPAYRLARRPFAERSAAARRVALARFSLDEIGVPRYQALYQALDAPRRRPVA